VAQSTHTPYSTSFDNANWLGPPSRKNQHKGSPCNTFFWQNACFSDQDAERTGIKARSALVLRALEQMSGASTRRRTQAWRHQTTRPTKPGPGTAPSIHTTRSRLDRASHLPPLLLHSYDHSPRSHARRCLHAARYRVGPLSYFKTQS
jgi:hypothetical protein